MKIVVIGSKGQLGSDLIKSLKNHELTSLDHDKIDVCDSRSCQLIKAMKPEVVINTAAFHRVDDCENEPEKSFLVNSIGAKNIASICNEIGAVAVYISTDYVFDGTKESPYTEHDNPNPINTYGISKLAGEQYTRYTKKHYIIRTSSLFGAKGSSGKGGNFVETMIKKAKNREHIEVVDDIISSPTYTKDAADAIKKMLEKKIPHGTYHVTNSGYCSWFDFANAIFHALELDANLTATKTKENEFKAKRPHFSALKSDKLQKYGLQTMPWKEALKEYLMEKKYL